MVSPPNTPTSTGGAGLWSDVGFAASWLGLIFGATNAYFGVEAQKGQLKQQASSFDPQSSMASINAQRAESDAAAAIEAGDTARMGLTLQQGQERASLIAGQAASGTTAGGSNAEVRASQRLLQRLDAMTLDSNTLRAVNAARTQKVNAQNESLLAGVSAQNLRGTAGSLNPWLAAGSSALSGVGSLSAQWVYRERYGAGRR
jgi:hypothetical protein